MNKKQNQHFDIKGMAKATHLSPAKIQRILGKPLGKKYNYASAEEARVAYYKAKYDSVEKENAFRVWIELFEKEAATAKSRREAIGLYRDAPNDTEAQRMILETIAVFFGLTDLAFCPAKLNNATTMKKAIAMAFKYLPCGKDFLGPKGKLIISRNECQRGTSMAEVLVSTKDPEDKRILFTAYWNLKKNSFDLKANWTKDGETLFKWNTKW